MTTTERLVGGFDRVTGPDESYHLAERLFGLSAPIQFLWVFTSDPGDAEVLRLRDQLSAGPLNRKVRYATVPFARDRWVRADDVPDVAIDDKPIGENDIASWLDTRVREGELAPAAGRGWRLDAARTRSGKLVLSLLVSHMISDGEGVYAALAAAQAGTSQNRLPTRAETGGWNGRRADVVDAAGQLMAAARALRILGGALRNQTKTPSPSRRAAPSTEMSPDAPGPDATLLILDVDRERWAGTAREHGGTTNSLFTAVLAGLVQRTELPVAEQLRVCMAVSKREAGDERANASGGVWIRIDGPVSPQRGLADIRALSKQAFIDYADAESDKMADNMQPVVRLLPGRLIGKLMQSVPGPDTTVSNLGLVPPSALRLGTETAESFGIRAIVRGRPIANRRAQGPAVAAWAVEYGDKVTITVFGIDPDHFGDVGTLRAQIGEELSSWGLPYTFW